MSERIPWDDLREVVGRFPEGASLEEVLLGLDPKIARRTLQRWLASLVKNNDLVAIGRARARRYKLFHAAEKEVLHSLKGAPFPITEAAAAIQEKVSQPLHARQPTTYNLCTRQKMT
jgi:hypothetical protein